MPMPLKKPSIFDFLDTILYLQAYFEWRKKMDVSFSNSVWCNELNLGNKTTLRFLLQRKRRISKKVAMNFKKQLHLSQDEELYFDYLLLYSQPRIEAERTSAGTKLIEMQRSKFKSEEFPESIVEIDVMGPILLTLIMFEDFSATEENIIKFLNVDSTKVKSILNFYLESGHIKLNNGVYSISTDSLKVHDRPQSKSLKAFHRFWLTEAQKKLDLDFSLRRVRSLNFALNQAEFESFVNQINDFAISLLSKYNHANLDGRRLYMFQKFLFPITDRAFYSSETIHKSSPDANLQSLEIS